MNEPFIQSVLFGSPYSGCSSFSGWRKAPCVKVPVQTTWPSPYGKGATMCVDRTPKTRCEPILGTFIHARLSSIYSNNKRAARPLSGPAKAIPVYPVYVTRTHFRPSAPYPMWIKGGPEPVKAMPSAWTQKVGVPPYNLRALSFPSTTGPYTYGIAHGVNGSLAEMVVGTGGQASQHSSGWS